VYLKCCPYVGSKEETRGGGMLEDVVGRPGVTRGQLCMSSKVLISRGFRGRAQVQRRAKDSSSIQSIWSF
jgi:hypothetical protein